MGKGTHHVNCWYQRCCNWNVYVKDGIVWREEQAASYEQTNERVSDYNPRGCQKGACFSSRMYDRQRVLPPPERVGQRGAGSRKRLSWMTVINPCTVWISAILSSSPGRVRHSGRSARVYKNEIYQSYQKDTSKQRQCQGRDE